jgi:hypothetical protein
LTTITAPTTLRQTLNERLLNTVRDACSLDSHSTAVVVVAVISPNSSSPWSVIMNSSSATAGYQCPGKNVAFIKLNKIFVELLRRYNFTVVDPLEPWRSWCAGIFLVERVLG